MNMDTRLGNYRAQRGGDAQPTSKQGRRIKHKVGSRKMHEHIEGARCYRCRPAKRPQVALTPRRISARNR